MFLRTAVRLLLALALSSFSFSAFAQTSTTGRIVGNVKDKNGAVIVGAKITVVNRATDGERKTITDIRGDYAVLMLPPGLYAASIKASGFKRVLVDDLRVNITQTTIVNAQLEIGDL